LKITGLAVLAVTLAASGIEAQASETAATVNGVEITRAEVDAQVDILTKDLESADSETVSRLRREVLEQLITQQLLWQAAEARGYTPDVATFNQRFEEVKVGFPSEQQFHEQIKASGFDETTFREDLKRRLAVEQLIARDIAPVGTVGDAEVDAFYAENLDAMQRPEEVRARHILIHVDSDDEASGAAARAKIERILAEARSGADFAALARQHSEGPMAAQGGDLGFFGHGRMVAPLERAAFALQPGEISDVVSTELGFHIIKAEARRAGGPPEKEDVSASIANYLMQQRLQLVLDAFVRDLRSESEVTVLLEN
jgi:peptidyl-prolyl cis-trans isomerase C